MPQQASPCPGPGDAPAAPPTPAAACSYPATPACAGCGTSGRCHAAPPAPTPALPPDTADSPCPADSAAAPTVEDRWDGVGSGWDHSMSCQLLLTCVVAARGRDQPIRHVHSNERHFDFSPRQQRSTGGSVSINFYTSSLRPHPPGPPPAPTPHLRCAASAAPHSPPT